VGAPLSYGAAFKFFMMSPFYNQVLPSFIPGDACRVWGAARIAGVAPAMTGIFLDRLIILIALLALIILSSMLFCVHIRAEFAVPVLITGLVALGVLLAMFAISRRVRLRSILPEKFGSVISAAGEAVHELFASARFFGFCLLLFIHLLTITIFYVLARGMNVPLTPPAALSTVPVAIAAALLPVSVDGWGIREGL
jgi:hypothetical protein